MNNQAIHSKIHTVTIRISEAFVMLTCDFRFAEEI